MGWQPKCERVVVGAASIGLIAMLLLTGSGQVSAGSYRRWAAVQYADYWTCHNCTPEP
jgi:hypothetical protein